MGRVHRQRWVKGWWCKIVFWKLCCCLEGRRKVEYSLTISWFVIKFHCKNPLTWIFFPCCNCPIDQSADAEAVSTGLKKLFLNAAVYRSAGWPFPTLIVSKSVFWNNSPKFVNHVWRHYIHRCHHKTWNWSDAVERDGEAVPLLNVFLQLAFWGWAAFCKALLWFPNVSASTKSCCHSFLLIFTSGHLLLSQRKASIWFHRVWSPKTCWRTEGGLNSFPLPSGESFCTFGAFPRSRSKLCAAPLSVNSKLNSGGVKVAQGVLMTALILLKWFLG